MVNKQELFCVIARYSDAPGAVYPYYTVASSFDVAEEKVKIHIEELLSKPDGDSQTSVLNRFGDLVKPETKVKVTFTITEIRRVENFVV